MIIVLMHPALHIMHVVMTLTRICRISGKNNPNRVIISHLNVNFLARKFDAIDTIIQGKVDVQFSAKLN